MANERERKRRHEDVGDSQQAKKAREQNISNAFAVEQTVGKVKRVFMRNFMCHDALEVDLNPNVNFIVGRNGSGKSAILTALIVGLGGKTKLTNRGSSLKGLVQNGKNSANVEISLTNAGVGAYKHEIYGDYITVCRTIGSSSAYRIKNWRGDVISTKREELDKIIDSMNIQVDNPISVLNQDVSRTFLVSSNAADKYSLFMKATRLNIIGQNYKDAHVCNEDSRRRLAVNERVMEETKTEIDQIKQSLQMLDSADEARETYKKLQIELFWAIVSGEEETCRRLQQKLSDYEKEVKKLEAADEQREERLKNIKKKIEDLEAKCQEIRTESVSSAESFRTAKQALLEGKEVHNAKLKDWRVCQTKSKRIENDIGLLKKEIERLEAGSSKQEAERQESKEKLAKFEQNLDEVEATLRTKQTDQMHLDADIREHLRREEHTLKIQVDNNNNKIRQLTQKLSAIKRQADNVMTVYSPNMPRLLKRIDEEFRKGKFKAKPRGPVGSFIKLKDPNWIPAVENFLSGILSAFCVDNRSDANKLALIMREVFRDERCPQIISSKFYDKVHNVQQHCTRSADYSSLLEMMEISDPVIANCLIDQREIECVLLIPTSEEACEVMCASQYVPHNCKKAFTQKGDLFFPAPNYKTYGGRPGMRAKFLQVSTTQAIQLIEEDLATVGEEQKKATTELQTVTIKINAANVELQKTNEKVQKLRTLEGQLRTAIVSLKDKLEEVQCNSIETFTSDMDHHQRKLQEAKAEELVLKREIAEQQTRVSQLDVEVKRLKSIVNDTEIKLNPIREDISQLKEQQANLSSNSESIERKMNNAKQNIEKCKTEVEKQGRVVDLATRNATAKGERVKTNRSQRELTRISNEVQSTIEMIENEYGSKDELNQQLQQKLDKYNQINEFQRVLTKSCQKHQERLTKRRRLFHEMKKEIGFKVQTAFQSILKLRKYKGSIKIDHKEKTLELEVNPQNDTKRPTNDAKSLSGGERSYSTVAFILALWDCTGLPFYFLDEFDVFMDKINRRIIMDLLLEHTRTHAQSQFTFLTPLDTSSIDVNDQITIHRLAPPERAEN